MIYSPVMQIQAYSIVFTQCFSRNVHCHFYKPHFNQFQQNWPDLCQILFSTPTDKYSPYTCIRSPAHTDNSHVILTASCYVKPSLQPLPDLADFLLTTSIQSNHSSPRILSSFLLIPNHLPFELVLATNSFPKFSMPLLFFCFIPFSCL